MSSASSDDAELSSIEESLRQLTARVVEMAERRDRDPEDVVSVGLFEVDRSLRTAQRQLERSRRRLG